MQPLMISRILFRLKYASRFQKCMAILLLATSCVYAILIPAAKQELATLKQTASRPVQAQTSITDIHTQSEHRFYDALPNSVQVKDILAHFYSTAEAEGLDVSTVQYSLEEAPDISFATYKLSTPLFGEYLHVMQLIKVMLETYPTVALTKLQFIRDDQKENLVTAELEFVIYMRKEP